MKLEEILNTLKKLKKQMMWMYKAEIVGVFGSYVRGEEKRKSDMDVLVRFQKGATLFDFVGLADFLEEKFGMKVDIVPIDTIRDEIKGQILKEAVYL